MSEPKLISPLLDNFIMGDPISEHDGVQCCPAINKDTDEKYIVKKPSYGLTGLSDEDNFGFTYSELDGFINGVLPESAEVGKKIIAMHTATEHKRCLPYCFRKE